MIPALAPIYIAQFAEYKDVLVLKSDPRPSIPAKLWFEEQNLITAMLKFKPQFQNEDLRGLASEWSKYYFVRLIPPVVVANLVLGWDLDLDIENISIVVDEHGLPSAFKLPNEGQPLDRVKQTPEHRFDSLIEANLTPFIEALHRMCGLSTNVFWSNAGNFFEWILGAMKQHGIPEDSLKDGFALLNSKLCERVNTQTGRKARNPLWQPVVYLNKNGNPQHRERRMCCVRYLASDMKLCRDCPRTTIPKSR